MELSKKFLLLLLLNVSAVFSLENVNFGQSQVMEQDNIHLTRVS